MNTVALQPAGHNRFKTADLITHSQTVAARWLLYRLMKTGATDLRKSLEQAVDNPPRGGEAIAYVATQQGAFLFTGKTVLTSSRQTYVMKLAGIRKARGDVRRVIAHNKRDIEFLNIATETYGFRFFVTTPDGVTYIAPRGQIHG